MTREDREVFLQNDIFKPQRGKDDKSPVSAHVSGILESFQDGKKNPVGLTGGTRTSLSPGRYLNYTQ